MAETGVADNREVEEDADDFVAEARGKREERLSKPSTFLPIPRQGPGRPEGRGRARIVAMSRSGGMPVPWHRSCGKDRLLAVYSSDFEPCAFRMEARPEQRREMTLMIQRGATSPSQR